MGLRRPALFTDVLGAAGGHATAHTLGVTIWRVAVALNLAVAVAGCGSPDREE